jgi:hypothetical protein
MPIFRLVHHIVDAVAGRTHLQQHQTFAHGQQALIPTPPVLLAAPVHSSCRRCCRRDRRRARRECRHSYRYGPAQIVTPIYQTQQQLQQPPYVHVTVEAPEMRHPHPAAGSSMRASRSEGDLSRYGQETGVEVREGELPPAYAAGEWNQGTKASEKH